jgi:hypothetical protein
MSERTPLTPLLLTAAAHMHVGYEEPARGRSAWVRAMLSEVDLPHDADWGVAYVSHIGHASHRSEGVHETSWPLPRVGDANRWADFAREKGVLYREPRFADVALVWSARAGRFHTAGVVILHSPTRVEEGFHSVTTIEGNVHPGGEPAGPGIYRVTRQVVPRSEMRFVRWLDLDERDAVSDPTMLRDARRAA